jgi:REP element-mobilizing transposase RayT
MARAPRLHVPGGLYHVLARGNNRQQIFRHAADYRFYLARLAQLLARTETHCYAYCLMPNHLHLLLEPGARPLSRIMQPLQLSYSLYFNRNQGHVGHVFQGRYMAILCERDAYMTELVRYLHLNPVRAGLTSSPEAWLWSSHRAYCEGQGRPVALRTEPVLGQFGQRPSRARGGFRRFVRDGMGVGHRADLYDVLEQRVLGSDAFAETVLRPKKAEPEPPVRVSIDAILEAVAVAWKLDREALRAHDRNRRATQARAAAAYLAREVAGHSLTAIAHAVNRDVSSLSLGVYRLQAARHNDPELAGRLAGAVAALRSGAIPQHRRRAM